MSVLLQSERRCGKHLPDEPLLLGENCLSVDLRTVAVSRLKTSAPLPFVRRSGPAIAFPLMHAHRYTGQR
jgi:hypothetical protein